jgi:CheY-like chemotaxis protein
MTSSEEAWSDLSPPWPHATSRRVLVAEDDAAMRDIVSLVLRERGCQVEAVSTGSELLSALGQVNQKGPPAQRFDLIVTDVRMPGASGLDAVDQMRRAGDMTPVIAVTAFPHPATRQRARRLEIELVAKPFALQTLRNAVDAALASLGPRTAHRRWES